MQVVRFGQVLTPRFGTHLLPKQMACQPMGVPSLGVPRHHSGPPNHNAGSFSGPVKRNRRRLRCRDWIFISGHFPCSPALPGNFCPL